MYALYSLALAAALLLSAPWWLLRMLGHHKYRDGLGERLGRVPQRLLARGEGGDGSIWVHAVSVGEVLAVSELIRELRRRFPERRVAVSTTTATGQALARERFGEENVFYFPLDFAFAVNAYLRALRPELVILAETEFWPNFLRLAKSSSARVAVVNARISDRSLPGYRRWRGRLTEVLHNVDVFLTQSDEDSRRLIEIGAEPERVRVAGNLKFDVKAPVTAPGVGLIRQALERGSGRPVIVCGSTLEGEEVVLRRAFEAVHSRYPAAVFIVAPRHPQRFDAVAQLMEGPGLRSWRRSQLTSEDAVQGGVLVLDTLGELASVYALGAIAFVGGSLVARGGHNVLEPAQHGVPILVGPHTENFRDIIGIFARADALRVVTPDNLAEAMLELLGDDSARVALGRRGAEVFRAQAGATARTLAALERLLAAAATPSAALPVPQKAAR
ncbi:MAG: 3-deoxy-D-manno-octulosonic acid transferase [Acidobacteria bacterium]|nr:3-deoxy-D-manno-octulosonic acid transferase [Acidobacteriota bacterium]